MYDGIFKSYCMHCGTEVVFDDGIYYCDECMSEIPEKDIFEQEAE